jgi:hypothetical protein
VVEKNGVAAKVFLDYSETGFVTDKAVTLENVPAGERTLSFFCRNYALKETTVVVEPKKATEVRFSLQQSIANGTLQVTAVPDSGAIVTINNIEFGRSPLHVGGLANGTYTVCAYYGTTFGKKDVTVKNDSQAVSLTLVPKRFAVVEYFSHIRCTFCPLAGGAIDSLLHVMPAYRNMLAKIAYHTSTLGGDLLFDPASDRRWTRFGKTSLDPLPAIFINGEEIEWTSNVPVFANAATRKIESIFSDTGSVESALFFSELKRDSSSASGAVKVKTTVTGARLSVMLLEDFIGYEKPPGSNKQVAFHAICRGVSPQADTAAVTPPEQTVTFSFDVSKYYGKELSVLALLDGPPETVNNKVVKKVLQSLRAPLP